jgi:hypothetical protein
MTRLLLIVTLPLMLSGCHTYLLDVESPSPSPSATDPSSSPPPVDKIAGTFPKNEIYTSVYAGADENEGQNVVSAYKSDFVANLVMDKQTNIAVTAVLPNSTVELPIYIVSNDGNNCQVAYKQLFLLTPQKILLQAYPQIVGKYQYDVKGTQQVSQYVADAAALAALFVPAASAPVLATVATVSNTALAQKVGTDLNGAFSQSIGLTRPLLDFTNVDPLTRSQTSQWTIYAEEIGNDSTIISTTTLGTLKLTVTHATTLLGTESVDTPTYSDPLTLQNAQLMIILPGSTALQISNLYDLVNKQPDSAASTVQQLDSTATASNVGKACNVLRSQLKILGLNFYDTTAFLWAIYSQAPYEAKDNFANQKSDCLVPAEMALIKVLKQTTPTSGTGTTLQSWGSAKS